MGDFGIGFLYVREDLLERVVRRTQIGYEEADEVLHYLPSDPPGDTPVTWTLRGDAGGHFEVGTYAQAPSTPSPSRSPGCGGSAPRRSRLPPATAGAPARGDASARLHLDHAA